MIAKQHRPKPCCRRAWTSRQVCPGREQRDREHREDVANNMLKAAAMERPSAIPSVAPLPLAGGSVDGGIDGRRLMVMRT